MQGKKQSANRNAQNCAKQKKNDKMMQAKIGYLKKKG